MGIDAARGSADDVEDGRRSGDGFTGRGADARAAAERAEPLANPEERAEVQRRAHRAVDEAYAVRAGDDEGARDSANSNHREAELSRMAPERNGERNGVSSGPDANEAGDRVEMLRRRVGELEADKAGQEQRIVALDKKIAEQAGTIAELRAAKEEQDRRIDGLATIVGELGERREEQRAVERIERRVNDGPEAAAERAEREPRRRLPTDAVNNVISAVAGGAVTDLAYHLKDLPPEYAGLGATGLTVAAGAVAVWRERRKAKDDADHRPEG